ncbi:hypothetical protein T484DRAFT_1834344, partial [Baffinella frigidus]
LSVKNNPHLTAVPVALGACKLITLLDSDPTLLFPGPEITTQGVEATMRHLITLQITSLGVEATMRHLITLQVESECSESASRSIDLSAGTLGLQISSLGVSVCLQHSLLALDVTGNGLRFLPPEIEYLHSLQTLLADNNSLSFLPPEVSRLTALTALSLRHNLLSAFPAEAVSLGRVRTLHLDHNNFVALPPSLQGFTVLSELSVEGMPDLEDPSPDIIAAGAQAVVRYMG